MKTQKDMAQSVIITLSDGSVHKFTGKAFAFKGDTRKIRSVKFTVPHPLPYGCSFAELPKE